MKKEAGVVKVGIGVEVVNPARIKGRGAANDAVYFIAFGEQQFREVRTVLPVMPVMSAFFMKLRFYI
nr:hypothetical protein [Verrucomicrobium spinosum]